MTNAWIAHVKAFATQRKMKYGDALKHPDCKSSYHSGKRTGKGFTSDTDYWAPSGNNSQTHPNERFDIRTDQWVSY